MNALMKLGLAALTAAIAFAEDDEPDLGPPPVGFKWARYIGGEDHEAFPAFTGVGEIVAVRQRHTSASMWYGEGTPWSYRAEWLDFDVEYDDAI